MQQPLATHLSPAGGIVVIPFTALDIAATAIRDMLRAGVSPRYLLPGAVLDYIRAKRLYTGS
jgi:nicotinate-nucleotide adenylyltransferase